MFNGVLRCPRATSLNQSGVLVRAKGGSQSGPGQFCLSSRGTARQLPLPLAPEKPVGSHYVWRGRVRRFIDSGGLGLLAAPACTLPILPLMSRTNERAPPTRASRKRGHTNSPEEVIGSLEPVTELDQENLDTQDTQQGGEHFEAGPVHHGRPNADRRPQRCQMLLCCLHVCSWLHHLLLRLHP